MKYDYEPVALTVIVTLTGSLSSPGAGAWPGVCVALMGEMVRGEDARGNAMVGPGKRTVLIFRIRETNGKSVQSLCFDTGFIVDTATGDGTNDTNPLIFKQAYF